MPSHGSVKSINRVRRTSTGRTPSVRVGSHTTAPSTRTGTTVTPSGRAARSYSPQIRAHSRSVNQAKSLSQSLARVNKVYSSVRPVAGLDPTQQHVLHTLLSTGTKSGASKSDKLSAVETGLVESHLSNPSSGDGSSVGWRQETSSSYPGVNRMNVKQSAQRFYNELKSAPAGSPGQRAQAVQRSAFPARYDQVAGQAKQLVKASQPKPNPKDVHKLQKAGIPTPADSQAKPSVVQASPQQVSRFKAVKRAASKLTSGHIPYVWGGGHGTFSNPKGGLDCSGAVSAVLHAAGVTDHPLTSGDMGSVLKPGPGAVTVYYNAGHTFMKIGDRYWGTSVGDSGSGGLGPHPNPSGSYLSQYNVGHVPGLGKQVATALGIKLTGGGSAVSASSGGGGTATTARFGGGAVKGRPGFSSSPIKALSNKQKLSRLNSVLGSTSMPSTHTLTASSLHGKPVV